MRLVGAVFLVAGFLAAQSATARISADRYVPEEDDSSRYMRRQQTVQAMVGTYGYSLGLLVSNDRIIEAGFSGLDVDDKAETWSEGGYLHTKLFHGNSFQTYWGVSWKESGFGTEPFKTPERTLGFVDAGLGNQWHWRHFTAGVDWVGVSVPVYERKEVREEGVADDGRVTASTRGWHRVDVHWLTLYGGLAI